MTKEEYISILKSRYDYLEDWQYEYIYGNAREKLLNALFPFVDDISEMEIPSKYQFKLVEAMFELVENEGVGSYVSYSENGVSWKKSETNVTTLQCLRDITPYAG